MTHTARTVAGHGLPTAWIVLLVALSTHLSAVGRFLGATVGLLLAVKLGAWMLLSADANAHDLSPLETLLYWTVWPGVRPDLFGDAVDGDDPDSDTADHTTPDAATFLRGYAHVVAGVVLAVAALLAVPLVGANASSWVLLFAVLSVVHFGVGRLLPFGLRWLGVAAPPLFDDPLASRSVAEFWSVRWNRPFVGMNRLFVTRPLAARFGAGVAAAVAFLVSGVLHELAISYTAGGGWGTPMLYFVVQAVLYTAEKTVLPDPTDRPVLGRLWTYAAVLAPLPLLFHGPFRATFVVPLVEGGRALLLAHPASAYLSAGLWAAAAGHFLVLVASARVPAELDWETDLASLDPFNRKLLWTYGGFIVLVIVSFGTLTAVFHRQLLAGTPVALGLCAFVATFWTARMLVDALYFSHDDWPEGVAYVVGHALLTSLFVLLVVVYAGTIAFHVL